MAKKLDPRTEELLRTAEEEHLSQTRRETEELEEWRARSETRSQSIYLR